MTEDEAKTKWCPHVRNGQAGSYSYNERRVNEWTTLSRLATGVVAVNTGAKCIASQCMAWRLATKAGERGGYCGLAGAA